MSVYVDDMEAKFGRMKMCHMLADSHDELIAMAKHIGVGHRWIQYPGTPREHFDICLAKKKKAIEAGAKAITWRECAEISMKRRIAAKNANADREEK